MRKLALFTLTAAAAAILPAAASAQTVVHHGPGTMTTHGSFSGGFGGGFHGGMFPHRLQPGFVVPPFWFGPQFHVSNWQMYGFSPPPRRHRWVRYYDDAYLIDHDGRIRDTRRGLDWDRYGERWDMRDGIPHYYGRGDWRPGPEDYAWVERHRGRHHDGGDYDYAEEGSDYYASGPGCMSGHEPCGGYGPPPGSPACHPGPQPCGGYGGYGYGYGAGYGYGYGVIAYPIVIETTVVSGGCDCAEEVVEEVVEVRERPRVRYYAPPPPRPRRVRPAPPPPGERG